MKKVITSPKGILEYPSLTKPDTKYVTDGVYKSGLYIEGAEAAEFESQLQDIVDKFIPTLEKKKNIKRADLPCKKPNDERTGLIFNFKCKAKGFRSDGTTWTQSPKIFDSQGNPFSPNKVIWGGTEARISFEPITYFTDSIGAGVSLRLKAVQIINLVEGASSADTYGFSKEKGFVANEVETDEEIQEENPIAANHY